MATKGIDVSHNNGVIDWPRVKAGGINFAMIRTGYARTLDTQYHNNMKGAIAAGIAIGIWHFSYALTVAEAEAEADFCCGLVKQYGIKPPIYFDFEYDSETYAAKKGVTFTVALRTAIHKAFCERVKALGYTPGIYTNGDYIKSRLDWSQLRGYLLWLAQWPLGGDKAISFADVKDTAVNKAYGTPAIWQIGKAAVPGCKYDTDINYGYAALPTGVSNSVQSVSNPASSVSSIKKGDKVRVKNVSTSGGVKRGNLYGGGTFVVYYDSYDVISVSGDRVAIGRGSAVTAAVKASDLELIK